MGDMANYYYEQDAMGYWETAQEDYDYYAPSPRPVGPGPCPRCKADTIKRHGIYGTFYGCTRFPQCKGSRNY